jgi:hypothetical protein
LSDHSNSFGSFYDSLEGDYIDNPNREREILDIIDHRRQARNNFYGGLTPEQIAQLPESILTLAKIADLKGECCSVCLDGYEEQTTVRTMRGCNHIFHKECIEKWLQR